MASDAAGARANLSEASDTLAGMTNLKSHRSAELFRDDIVGDLAGDEAGVRANLSQASDTLVGMAKSKSHQPAELFRDDIVGDLAGDEAGVRGNLSQAPDTLAGMAKSKSHPSGELSRDDIVDDMASGETGTRGNLSEASDTLAAMAKSKSHPSGELSRDDIVDDMESGETGTRGNLSEASDTLAAMAKSKSHPWGELSVDDIVDDVAGDEAGVRANLSQASDTLVGMAKSKSHQPGDLSPGEATTRCEPGGRQVLPEGLGEMAAGAALAAVLETVDLGRLNGHDLVTVLRAGQRQVSHYQAVVYAAMAETAYAVSATTTERSSLPNERAADEIAAAVGYTRRKACNELNTALRLREQLPEVAAALESGDIDGHKASVISDGTAALKLSAARGVADKILVFASRLTVGQIGARLRRLCILEDPGHAQARYEQSLERRRVVARPTADGTTHLHISDCAPHLAQAATDRVNRIARSLKTRHESRSVDQLRADVALDLLTGRRIDSDEDGGGGSVNLHVDLTTLARLDDHPGELSGYGPVVSDIARQVAEEQQEKSEWNAVVSDPETGEPLHVVSVRRRPTTRQQKMIRALHPVCVFPGCRMPAVDCDLDHCVDYAFGGPTTVGNHAPLCRHHHLSKHQDGWRYAKTGRVAVEWVSPFGHTYRTGAGLAGERWTGGRDPP